ncbi:MAG: polysaccharide biosynthesis protein [Deltaproteobacteria bacterium]|nr:polysaccharide biosynthesis protein [Deltaproteobacteria bacterium]
MANLFGSGWGTLIGLVCTPLFIRFLGMDAYGLIGFFVTLQGVVQIVDMGLSPTMNREMARYSVLPEKAAEARDFVRTLEIGYWALGILIGVTIVLSAPIIASHWIRPGRLTVGEVRSAIAIMGLLVALQWPFSLYQGGLLGLQRQVLLSCITVATSTLGSLGAVLILWKVSPTLLAFFLWQIGIVILQVAFTTVALWRSLPAADQPARIVPRLVRNVGRFAIGVSGISVMALVLTQFDKVILSKMLDLKSFGYYVLAGVVGNGLMVLVAAMFNTVYPRFCALVVLRDEQGLKEIYHGSTQILAIMILPVASVIVFFSRDIVFLWIQDPVIAQNVGPIAAILTIGTALNGMMNIPFALQLAHGWTRLGLVITAMFVFTFVPTMVVMCARFGAIGAAAVWASLNAVYMVLGVPLTHRKLLRGEAVVWLARDFLPPLAAAVSIVVLGRAIHGDGKGPASEILFLGLLYLCALIGSGLAAPLGREELRKRILAILQ